MTKNNNKISLISLGGLGEIGKNMTVVRYGNDIIVIDSGLAFPDDDMPGIDLVIPDMTYLVENKDYVRAVVLTHGHEDHIGSLAYLLKQINVPVYGTNLTLGLAEGKLKENNISNYNLIPVQAGDSVKIGEFEVGFIRVSHSIADAVGLYFKTPVGTVVHTGDFKIDQTPVDGKLIDIHKFAELGDQGVLVLLSDSTNAERPGYTMSEKTVGETLKEEFAHAKGRIILATFASNVLRLSQAIQTACQFNRKVAVNGRSMKNVVEISQRLGYLTIPEGVLIDIEEIDRYPANQLLILTTGSQGEPLSGLSRMASSTHRQVYIAPEDTVIVSATPIPGNEKLVGRTINSLLKLGAYVVYERTSGVHVSGHASQEELKLMLNLVRPKYFVPVHGEYRMLVQHSKLAQDLGIPKENIFIGNIGNVFEFTQEKGVMAGKVTAGKVLVDGLGVGDVGNIVLRDRRQLSQDGIIIVVMTLDKERGCVLSGPDIVSRGFVYVRDSERLMEELKEKVQQVMDRYEPGKVMEWSVIKSGVRDALGKFIYEKTRRRPMIIPIIMEV
ncbi:ribonuclease J [Sporomusaceae bacterium FL31]|nr:ribonuclease J [Sporomusaceae bacterium FL31]GCE35241.1 ribonuclease J [Sporomusaceae bacterium]